MTSSRRLDNLCVIRSPHGTELSAKGWLTEAPLRMLMNNLDPDVAEKPDELVVYVGIGRAARDWPSFDRIVATLLQPTEQPSRVGTYAKTAGRIRTHIHP